MADINVLRGIARALIPIKAFLGLRALNVQTYTESNVKLGLQYESSARVPSLAGGAKSNLILITGSKPVIIKDRQIGCTGAGITARVYKNPTYSGGSPQAVYNLRQDDVAVPTTVQLIAGVTVSAVGTEIAAATHVIGNGSGPLSNAGTFSSRGLERVLPANGVYLLEITNNDSGAIQLGTYVTWYEGTPDLPTEE